MSIQDRFNLVQTINASIEEALRGSLERVPGFTDTAAEADTEPAPVTDEEVVDRLLGKTERLLDALRAFIPKLSEQATLERINTSLTAIKQMECPPGDGRVKRIFNQVTDIQEKCAVKLSPPPLFSRLPEKYREICLHSDEESWKNLEKILSKVPNWKQPYIFCLLDLFESPSAQEIACCIRLIKDSPVEKLFVLQTSSEGGGESRFIKMRVPNFRGSFEEKDLAEMMETLPDMYKITALKTLVELCAAHREKRLNDWSFLKNPSGIFDTDVIGAYFVLKYLGLEAAVLPRLPDPEPRSFPTNPKKIGDLFKILHERNLKDFQRKHFEPFNIKFPSCPLSKAPDTILCLENPLPTELLRLSKEARAHIEELDLGSLDLRDLYSRGLSLNTFPALKKLCLARCVNFSAGILNELPDEIKRKIEFLDLTGCNIKDLDLTKFTSLKTVRPGPGRRT